jgi:hypothetical protein
MNLQETNQTVACPHRDWGHCKECNTWSYSLSTANNICPKCNEKLKNNDATKS